MCICIFKPAGVTLSKELYARCHEEHDHGSGYAFVDNGELVVRKGFKDDKQLLESLGPIEEKEMLIHFRKASPGMGVNAKNCHPFLFHTQVDEANPKGLYQWAVIHNGKLDWRHTQEHSDTSCFVHDLLHPHFERDPYMIETEIGRIMLSRTIYNKTAVNPNKMVIMRYNVKENKAETWIINPWAGFENKKTGTWFSNDSYKPKPKPKPEDDYCEIYKHSEYYSKPDSLGWRWDYILDAWWHEETKTMAEVLGHRQPPYGVEKYQPHTKKRHNEWLLDKMSKELPSNQGELPKLTAGDIAELSKPGDAPAKNEQGDIQVPRDPEVLPKSHNSSVTPDPITNLTMPERAIMVVEAEAMYRRMGWSLKEIKRFDEVEKINDLRTTVVELFPEHSDGSIDFLDAWIIGRIKDSTFRHMCIERETEIARVEKDAEKASINNN